MPLEKGFLAERYYRHAYMNTHYNLCIFFSDMQLQTSLEKQSCYQPIASELQMRPDALTASIPPQGINFAHALKQDDNGRSSLPIPQFSAGLGFIQDDHFLFVENQDILDKVSTGQVYTIDQNEFITGDAYKMILAQVTQDLYKQRTLITPGQTKMVKMFSARQP
jgi:hypothetical protein